MQQLPPVAYIRLPSGEETVQLRSTDIVVPGGRQNVRLANEIAHRYSREYPVRALAGLIIEGCKDVHLEGPLCIAQWIRDNVRYVQETPGVEILQGPFTTLPSWLKVGNFQFTGIGCGDCDDLAILFACLCRAAGLKAYFAGVAPHEDPELFIHAIGYCAENGAFYELSLDEPYAGMPGKPVESPLPTDGNTALIYDVFDMQYHRIRPLDGREAAAGENSMTMRGLFQPSYMHNIASQWPDALGTDVLYNETGNLIPVADNSGLGGPPGTMAGFPYVMGTTGRSLADIWGNRNLQNVNLGKGSQDTLNRMQNGINRTGANLGLGNNLTEQVGFNAETAEEIRQRMLEGDSGFRGTATMLPIASQMILAGGPAGVIAGAGLLTATFAFEMAKKLGAHRKANRSSDANIERPLTALAEGVIPVAQGSSQWACQRAWLVIRAYEAIPIFAGTAGFQGRNGTVKIATYDNSTPSQWRTPCNSVRFLEGRTTERGINYIGGTSSTQTARLIDAHADVVDKFVRCIGSARPYNTQEENKLVQFALYVGVCHHTTVIPSTRYPNGVPNSKFWDGFAPSFAPIEAEQITATLEAVGIDVGERVRDFDLVPNERTGGRGYEDTGGGGGGAALALAAGAALLLALQNR